MRTRIRIAGAISLVVCLSLFLAISGQAGALLQEDNDGEPDVDLVTPVPPLEAEEEPEPGEGEEEVAAAGELAIEAAPLKTMNYQGVLKDGDGALLNGTYDMTFRLFSAPAAGSKRWGDEIHPDVAVQDGLFQVVLGEILAIDPYTVFDEQLYLEVEVDGVVLPRQPLRAVPYAMGLVAGTRVTGATAAPSQYGLYVSNSDGRAIYADATVGGAGNGIISLYNADVLYSAEGYSGPSTYIYLAPADAVIQYTDRLDAHIEPASNGDIVVRADQAGALVDVIVPIQFERPYGRNYRVAAFTVYYEVSNANTYITATYLRGRNFSTGLSSLIESSSTDRKSTDYASYSVDVDPDFAASTTFVPTNVEFRITTGAVGQTVSILGVRVQLLSDY